MGKSTTKAAAKKKAKAVIGPQCGRCAKPVAESEILPAEGSIRFGGPVRCLPKQSGPSLVFCSISCAVAE